MMMMMSIDSIGRAMERVPNLNAEIVQQIADKLGMKFTPEKHPSNPEKLPSGGNEPTPTPPAEGMKCSSA
ncbi:MAG: hypothetical protein ACK6BZ_02255 [Candidatus Kapaibacterium sp.]|jgi:hypothetical protein